LYKLIKFNLFNSINSLLRDSKNLVFAHIAQVVEHFLGKEEVTGSTPVMSSIIRTIFIYLGKNNG
jgi:hypothetical protein